MPMNISRIVQALEPSATIAMATKAKELKAAGEKVYDLSLGEPDFDTPEHIRQAALEAMNSGRTHYTQAGGIPELKKAIVEGYQAAHGLELHPGSGGGFQRCQALPAQRLHRAARPRRRGDHSRSLLGQLRRVGQADRSGAGDRRRPSSPKDFKLTPGCASRARLPTRPRCFCFAVRRTRPAACIRRRIWALWPTLCSSET